MTALVVGSAATITSVLAAACPVGYSPMIYTRRILLTLTGLAVLGIAIPACRKMLGQMLFSPKAPQVPPPPLLVNLFKHGSKSLVAMALGLGARGPHEVALLTANMTAGSSAFTTLVADIRHHAGLRADDAAR
jgi:hypothetical protein